MQDLYLNPERHETPFSLIIHSEGARCLLGCLSIHTSDLSIYRDCAVYKNTAHIIYRYRGPCCLYAVDSKRWDGVAIGKACGAPCGHACGGQDLQTPYI